VTAAVVIGVVVAVTIRWSRPLAVVTGSAVCFLVSESMLVGLWALVVAAGSYVVVDGRKERRNRLSSARLPEVADAIASSWRASGDLAASIRAARSLVPQPLRGSYESATTAMEFGVPTADVMVIWRRSAPQLPEVLLLLAALELAGIVNDIRPVHDVAAKLRLRRLRREDVAAQVAQARASAAVVGLSPWVVLGLATAVDPGYVMNLVSSGLGRWCLLGAASLSVAGVIAMRALIRASGLS
jgi:Flp pilus assembly protein TadB